MSATEKPQRRQRPGPERQFVNRVDELNLVKSKLDRGIRGEQMPSAVVCFWGAYGMGKSWLLFRLEDLCKNGGPHEDWSPPGPVSHPTVTARLDLDREIRITYWQGSRLNCTQLIRELWKQLAEQLRDQVPEDLEQASPDEWAGRFVEQVVAWSAQFVTPVIMLDTLDDLVLWDESSFFWLEQQLVERLALADRVLFVFTSRGELRRWKRFQVRRRVDSHRLMAFDPEHAGEEVKASPAMSRALYQHSFGHPLVTEFLGTALEKRGISLQQADVTEQIIDRELVHDILKEVVDKILQELPPDPHNLVAKLALPASVLRWVSVEPLRALAEGLHLVEPGWGDAFYLDKIGQLQAHHLLYWNLNRNSYEPDPVLRRLLAYALELDDHELFCSAHQVAYNFHHDHLHDYPTYLDRYVPELAYHHAILARHRRPPQPSLWEWWDQFAAQAPAAAEPWTELIDALDQDEELKGLSPKDYDRLLSEARRQANEPTH